MSRVSGNSLRNDDLGSNGHNVITVEDGEWKDWTSTWRKAGKASQSHYVTMSGTITRGKKKGQSVNVELDLTDHEIMQMSQSHEILNTFEATTSSDHDKSSDSCTCGVKSGPHITLISIICFPFILIISFLVSFYFGLLTWQNIFNYYYDERTICHRIFLCPLLVLLFPILIIMFSLPIAIYAAFVQLSWSYEDWKIEVGSFEKGFYGWFCSSISLESCSPYIVVTLTESENPDESHLPNESNLSVIEDTNHRHIQNSIAQSQHPHTNHFMPESRNVIVNPRMESVM